MGFLLKDPATERLVDHDEQSSVAGWVLQFDLSPNRKMNANAEMATPR